MNQFRERLKRAAQAGRKVAANTTPDSLMVCGAAAISYGSWMVYAPAGFIVGGVLLIAAGVLAARGAE